MATISDVARQAGVSPVTVSRVLNNTGNVSPATQQRVQAAIDALGYVPSGVARSLRSRQTRTLALIVPDVTNAFWTTVARGVEDAAQSRGYSVFLCNTDESPAKQDHYLEVVISQRVDGVLIAPFDSDASHLARLRSHHMPTVVIDRHIQGWEVDTVSGDSLSGARALVKHLIDLGHRCIAIISGPNNTSTSTDRVAGYRIALAEAGIAEDSRLIRFGEFRAISGERLVGQILDSGANPTAIFAANNAIAMGVIDALEKRRLRIPQDIALVCFDDLPNTSRLFPFLTVAFQPAYEIGANAAQLLLSRLDADVSLQPRHVVLPTRLIVRHSCGNYLKKNSDHSLSLPLPFNAETPSVLVPRVNLDEMHLDAAAMQQIRLPLAQREWRSQDYARADVNRLLKVLRHREADRLPHLEVWITSQPVYEYVLERKLDYRIDDARIGGQSITPEDHVEFAQRIGMDVVMCDFAWRPNNVFARASDGTEHYVNGTVRTWSDLEKLEPPPSLASQLNYLERYLRAAQGTAVGVVANFTSFFDSALLAIGVTEAMYLFYDNRPFLEKLMDLLLHQQSQVMQAVCDRFAEELAFVLVNDDIAHNSGLLIQPEMFADIFSRRMKRLIAPAKEHGKLVAIHTDGRMDQALPILHDVGFDIVHPIAPESNDIFSLREKWRDKLVLMGNIPTMLLAYGSKDKIDEQVRDYCARLAAGGGYVLSSSTSIMEGIPPENFLAMVQAVHRYGRYDSLGQAASLPVF